MATTKPITLFHSPQTRSSGALALLEALGAPYTLKVVNMKAGEQRQAKYLAMNPMGKVPAILHGDTVVTEQVAIGIYLADLHPEAGITPAIDSDLRGAYLRWYVFYAACFEPALICGRACMKSAAGCPSHWVSSMTRGSRSGVPRPGWPAMMYEF